MTEQSTTAPFRFSVDPWDPAYGVSVDFDELEPSSADVVLDVEVPASDWAPATPMPETGPLSVLFVDGVRRVDAHVWIDAGDGTVHPGIFASYSAGAVCCEGDARLVAAQVGRGLFTCSPLAAPITTSVGVFGANMASGATPEKLSLALQDAMGGTEAEVAESARAEHPVGLIVVDGPLRGQTRLAGAVGFIKTHQVAYLPSDQGKVVGALAPGQRTPVFVLGTTWRRQSWYLRLPGDGAAPWAGIVRCECSADIAPARAAATADTASAILPRFASESHKDPRAPQNLYPIGALERELRRRLGDPQIVYRALRVASRQTSA
jgi:hypothetical protein